MIEGNAWLKDVNKGKSLMFDTRFYQVCQMVDVAGETPGNQTGASGSS